ncbi:MAG: hypothetical protein A2033_18435 [Bacteroidetes bacterium GWA2_31_9]|nr:MAG: hypothetical protein A2033_18435 [Bacteroidetes bacterium GWA2_31_9]
MIAKNLLLSAVTFAMLVTSLNVFSQVITKKNSGFEVVYNQNKSSEFTLDINLSKYKLEVVEKNGIEYTSIVYDHNIKLEKKGWADLPFISTSVQLSNDKNVSLEVIDEEFEEIELDKPLLPSRGVIYRNQNPSKIPYEIDPQSIVNEFYPTALTEMSEPYIIRDVRGTNIKVFPFRYNSASNKLRVYKKIRVKVVDNDSQVINPLVQNRSIAKGISAVYQSIFINFSQNSSRWTNELGEFGDILVIYTARDTAAIQPWITWKKQMGYNVFEQQVAVGTNVKTLIQTEYNSNPNILYVQLVGDWAEIKSDLGGSENTPMDPMLGCVVGSDDYHDLIVGRFSASTVAHVTTQGDKAINYEKNPDLAGTWYSNGIGIGSDEGSGIGDDGEIDYDHINNIKVSRLVPFTYSGNITEAYGASVATTEVSIPLNSGVGVINYCGHGAKTYWVTSDYSTTSAGSATNGDKLPFAFSVACVVGEFNTTGDCLAEALLRKQDGGALAAWMSTMNQPWTPPMRGQDYANDILTQGYDYTTNAGDGISTTYGKTTFGGITYNAANLMVTESTTSSDWDTYKTWTIFGDASVQVRTEMPHALTISNPSVTPGLYTTQIFVDGLPFEGALVSLYNDSETQPSSAMTDVDGNVSITHPFTGTVTLTVTGFNLATYSADHVVAVSVAPICDFEGVPVSIIEGETVTFNDLSQNYPASRIWNFDGGNPATSTLLHPVITYDTVGTFTVSLKVMNMAGEDSLTKIDYITVNPVFEAPVTNFIANKTNLIMGESVDFTDLSNNLPSSWLWTFDGGTPSSSTEQNPTGIIYSTPGAYNVTLEATNAFGTGTELKLSYINVALPVYCDALSNSTAYEFISNVSFGDINNTSVATAYSDFTSNVTDILLGESKAIGVTISGTYSTDQIFIWIDWNKNGVFTDAGEDVFVSANAGVSTDYTYNTTVTAPLDASLGEVRIRIRLHDSAAGPMSDPCGNSDYGEVEDYSLNVISNITTSEFNGTKTVVTNVYPNPASVFVNIASKNIEQVCIYNLLGQDVFKGNYSTDFLTLDLLKYQKGIYFIKVTCSNKATYIQKLILK